MRVITWNVAGRRSRSEQQVVALGAFDPDIVALQEVRISAIGDLTSGLKKLGLQNVLNSFQLASDHSKLVGPRQYGEIIATRFPIEPLRPENFRIPWPERVLSCRIKHAVGDVDFHTTHIPPGVTNKWIKIETFEGIFEKLALDTQANRILCGDFNSPDQEFSDGRVKVFGERLRKDGSIVPQNHRGQPPGRWSKGERSVITGLSEIGMPDVFRALHGYEAAEGSWFSQREGKLTVRRFDHIFASPQLNPTKAQYLHALRETKLSDHSPLLVDFSPS